MKVGDYDIDIVVQGFPGKSVCHGGLGWSTVVLLRAYARTALIDAGSFGMRTMLLKRLKDRGLQPADVTDLLLTHSHHEPLGELGLVLARAHYHRRTGTGVVARRAVGRDAGARALRARA
jgi:glyoxylase-like metal-dependent hydrolase (beta-lactamase superfamily II)